MEDLIQNMYYSKVRTRYFYMHIISIEKLHQLHGHKMSS
jgi:hypothetical protein